MDSLMYHRDCQSVWFNVVKNEDVWKGILTMGARNGMKGFRLTTTEGRDELTMQ